MSKFFLQKHKDVKSVPYLCLVAPNAKIYNINDDENSIVNYLNAKNLRYQYSTIKDAPSDWINVLLQSSTDLLVDEME